MVYIVKKQRKIPEQILHDNHLRYGWDVLVWHYIWNIANMANRHTWLPGSHTWISVCANLYTCLRKPGWVSAQTFLTICEKMLECLRKSVCINLLCLSALWCLPGCANLPVPLRKPICAYVPACRRKPGFLLIKKLHNCTVSIRCRKGVSVINIAEPQMINFYVHIFHYTFFWF